MISNRELVRKQSWRPTTMFYVTTFFGVLCNDVLTFGSALIKKEKMIDQETPS